MHYYRNNDKVCHYNTLTFIIIIPEQIHCEIYRVFLQFHIREIARIATAFSIR